MFDALNDPIIHFIGENLEVTVILQISLFCLGSDLFKSLFNHFGLFLDKIVKNIVYELRFRYFELFLFFYIIANILLSQPGSSFMHAIV